MKDATRRSAARERQEDGEEQTGKIEARPTDERLTAPPDAATVRDEVNHLVRAWAPSIVQNALDFGGTARVSLAKYLFEVAGLYPPREESQPGDGEESLAQILLRRLNLPVDPVIHEDDDAGCEIASASLRAGPYPGSENSDVGGPLDFKTAPSPELSQTKVQ